ncbi:hypothetical protein C3L33_21058, partial [Rhododendron williamsianum]
MVRFNKPQFGDDGVGGDEKVGWNKNKISLTWKDLRVTVPEKIRGGFSNEWTVDGGGGRVDPVHGKGGGALIHSQFGNKWATIARFHNGRSNNMIKNHWNSVLKLKHSMAAIDGVKERNGRRGRSLQNLQIWKWDVGGGGCCLMILLKFMGFVG